MKEEKSINVEKNYAEKLLEDVKNRQQLITLEAQITKYKKQLETLSKSQIIKKLQDANLIKITPELKKRFKTQNKSDLIIKVIEILMMNIKDIKKNEQEELNKYGINSIEELAQDVNNALNNKDNIDDKPVLG